MRYLCPTGVEHLSIGGATYNPITLTNGSRVFDLPNGLDYNQLLPGWVQYHSVYPEPIEVTNVAALAVVTDNQEPAKDIAVADPRENNPVENVAPEDHDLDELLGHGDVDLDSQSEDSQSEDIDPLADIDATDAKPAATGKKRR